MKLPRLTALLSVLLLHVSAPAQPSSGVIEGRVFNAATGSALANARVTLESGGRSTLTDDTGAYRFTGVPAGTAKLGVEYLGMTPTSAEVTIAAGATVRREFELSLGRAPEGPPPATR